MKTALLVALLTMIGLLATSSHASEPPFDLVAIFEIRLRGDIDRDNQVTIEDAMRLQESLLGIAPPPSDHAVADADADDTLGPGDVAQILRWATGKEPHPGVTDARLIAVYIPDVLRQSDADGTLLDASPGDWQPFLLPPEAGGLFDGPDFLTGYGLVDVDADGTLGPGDVVQILSRATGEFVASYDLLDNSIVKVVWPKGSDSLYQQNELE